MMVRSDDHPTFGVVLLVVAGLAWLDSRAREIFAAAAHPQSEYLRNQRPR